MLQYGSYNIYEERNAYQHSSLGNITGLSLLLRDGLHVITVCGHGGVRRRGVYCNHLNALVLEELHQTSQIVDSNYKTESEKELLKN